MRPLDVTYDLTISKNGASAEVLGVGINMARVDKIVVFMTYEFSSCMLKIENKYFLNAKA